MWRPSSIPIVSDLPPRICSIEVVILAGIPCSKSERIHSSSQAHCLHDAYFCILHQLNVVCNSMFCGNFSSSECLLHPSKFVSQIGHHPNKFTKLEAFNPNSHFSDVNTTAGVVFILEILSDA